MRDPLDVRHPRDRVRTEVCGRGHGDTSQLVGPDTLVQPNSPGPPTRGDLECRGFFFFFFSNRKRERSKEHFACKWAAARRAH